MSVPSALFFVLAAVSACLFNLFRWQMWRRSVLLVTNVALLGSFVDHPIELVPYVGFLVFGYALIQILRKNTSTLLHGAAIIAVLIIFCWLKQYSFLPREMFISSPYLAVGLSYVFFRVMHLVVDSPDMKENISVVDYINYLLNFTCLVSGPIQRYPDYHRMTVKAPLPLRLDDIGRAFERIVTGLFKIWVLAVGASAWQEHLKHQLVTEHDFSTQLYAITSLVALYPIYLFFNFSGYTDIVIGVARFFRIQLPENFDRPFSAASFIEYWSRWHMSLSDWLKTYVYNPLITASMRRLSSPAFLPYLSALALFATFFLIGVWHGRTSEFFFFGLLNGLGMAVNQSYRIAMTSRLGRKRFAALSKAPLYLFVGRGLTFAWVALTLLWFWSDWQQIGHFASTLGFGGLVLGWTTVFALASMTLGALQLGRRLALAPSHQGDPVLLSRYVRASWLTTMIFVIVSVQNAVGGAAPDVVYKHF